MSCAASNATHIGKFNISFLNPSVFMLLPLDLLLLLAHFDAKNIWLIFRWKIYSLMDVNCNLLPLSMIRSCTLCKTTLFLIQSLGNIGSTFSFRPDTIRMESLSIFRCNSIRFLLIVIIYQLGAMCFYWYSFFVWSMYKNFTEPAKCRLTVCIYLYCTN